MKFRNLSVVLAVLLSATSALAEGFFDQGQSPQLPNPNQSSKANVEALREQGVTCDSAKVPAKKAPLKKKAPTKKAMAAAPAPTPSAAPVACPSCPEVVACPVPEPREPVKVVETKTIYVERVVLVPQKFRPRLHLGLGYSGTAVVPLTGFSDETSYDYMWQQGPAVELRVSLTPSHDVFVNVAVPMGANDVKNGPGHWKAVTVQGGLDVFSERHPWVGLSGGLYASHVGFEDGLYDETFLGGTAGLAFRAWRDKPVKLYVHLGLFAGAGLGDERTQFSLGPNSNAMLMF